MAADVNDIVAFGFGSWSSVNSLPTLGFGIATVVLVSGPFRVSAMQAHISGADAAQVHVSGADAAQVHISGADAAQAKAE